MSPRAVPIAVLAFVVAATFVVSAGDSTEARVVPEHRIDHVVLGISDLGEGVLRFEERTGVRPVMGGEHPGIGTHNALVALGPRQYLEIVAPRPDAERAVWLSLLTDLSDLTLLLWVVATDDIERTQAALQAAGYETSDPVPGSRIRPDGAKLEWRTLSITKPAIAAAPFFIEWGDASAHPSSTSPGGCTLQSFAPLHPEPAELQRLIDVLGLEIEVGKGERATLFGALACPKGEIELQGG